MDIGKSKSFENGKIRGCRHPTCGQGGRRRFFLNWFGRSGNDSIRGRREKKEGRACWFILKAICEGGGVVVPKGPQGETDRAVKESLS